MPEDIRAAMATRDLMSAIHALSELPADLVRTEFLDLELCEARLNSLVGKIYDCDTVRELRLRSHGHQKTASGSVAVREVSTA